MESNSKSKLFNKARGINYNSVNKKIINCNNKIIKDTLGRNKIISEKSNLNCVVMSEDVILPEIKKFNPVRNYKPSLRLLKPKLKNLKEYLKDHILKYIQFYLDLSSLKNFMLTCKKFNNSILTNDELWYNLYIKRFNNKNIPYHLNRSKWKETFFTSIAKIQKTNHESLKTKFLSKMKKNIYQARKDPYYISNHLYSNLQPKYSLELDNKIYPIKYIFSSKILSHINFFVNFDSDYIDMNKLKTLTLLITEKNLGKINQPLVKYDIKKKDS